MTGGGSLQEHCTWRPCQGGESEVAPSLIYFFCERSAIRFFYTILYYSCVEKSAKNPLDDDKKTRLEPYGTTTFGISNPVPSRGYIFARYRGHGRQDGALASDERHGIIPKNGQERETEFSLKD